MLLSKIQVEDEDKKNVYHMYYLDRQEGDNSIPSAFLKYNG